jgi:alpha-1,3-rhamnosyl/mannosyltransferase
MRLGVDVREWEPRRRTGIGTFLEMFLGEAPRQRPGLTLLLYGNGATALPPAVSVAVRRLPEPFRLWFDQIGLARGMRADGVEVFLSPYYKMPLACPCPGVITIHDLLFLEYPPTPRHATARYRLLFRLGATLMARRAAAVLTDSEWSRRQILRRFGLPGERVVVTPLGVSPRFRPVPPEIVRRVAVRYGLQGDYVLYVGNFRPHKNVAALLEAYAALPDSVRARVSLALAGDPETGAAPLKAAAAARGLAQAVRFLGSVPDADLPALYSGATAFCFPSLAEGFGLPPLEAMACGAPVLCSDAAALPEVVGEAASLVNARHPEAIAAALESLLADGPTRAILRDRGLIRAAAFTPERFAARVLEVLERVLHGRGAR